MKTVWLENMVAFQPARWLPGEYESWEDLLAGAVEAAVQRSAGAAGAGEVEVWRLCHGGDRASHLWQGAVAEKVCFNGAAAAVGKRDYGEAGGRKVCAVGAIYGGPCGSGPLDPEHCEWAVGKSVQSVLRRPVRGVVPGNDVRPGVQAGDGGTDGCAQADGWWETDRGKA